MIKKIVAKVVHDCGARLKSDVLERQPSKASQMVCSPRQGISAGKRATLATLATLAAGFWLLAATLTPAEAKMPFLDNQRGVLTVAPIIEKAAPAVVNISVRSTRPSRENPLFADPFFRRFFGVPDELPEPEREALSAGSGVIVDAKKGYILTNHHVIKDGDQITVRLHDKRQYTAKLIGSDPRTDIALLQIKAKGLSDLPFGKIKDLKVGDFVIAIGNPFGLGQTVTSGIVSALGRSGLSAENYENFIQTDAPINPGNSGGPLLDTRGRIVGINTAIIAPSGGNVGIGFAVPSDMAQAVMAQLIRYGKIKRGRLGIIIQDITPDIATALNLPVSSGALISQVEKGSAAEKAGLQPGDAIIKVDGVTLHNSNELRNIVGLRELGAKLKLTIIRNGRERVIPVRIGKSYPQTVSGRSTVPLLSGATITDIPADHPMKGDVSGVLVAQVTPGSPAWRYGLRRGDIIMAVNQRPVPNLSAFARIAKAAGDVLALNILRGDIELLIVAR